MMERSKLVKFNKIFVYICAWWASLANELNLPYADTVGSLEGITLVWSGIIFVTNFCKFSNVHEHYREVWPSCDIFLLNYLPRLDEFSKLYYGLSSVCIGAPLAWRLYLAYYKPLRSYAATSPGRDAASRLVCFFMYGPQPSQQQQQQQQPQQQQVLLEDEFYGDESLSDAFTTDSLHHNEHFSRQNNRTPLALAHQSQTEAAMIRGSAGLESRYLNPMRAGWCLDKLSADRWIFLAAYVYGFVLIAVILGLPIVYFTTKGLQLVVNKFADPGLLIVYGIFEIIYVIGQSVMLFGFTNYFITLFYADLIFKIKQVASSLNDLTKLYKYSNGPGKSGRSHIYNLQLLIWSYFDTLAQFDRFVSKYSAVSIVTFIIGLSFGQSCFSVGEPALKLASVAVLSCNFASFTFLYILSSDIEQRVSSFKPTLFFSGIITNHTSKSTKLHSNLLSIVARDPDFATKRAWQRTLIGFYQSDRKRTFTMDNQYPLDLYSYFKTVFGLLTMSLVTSRLFHKRAWENGFDIVQKYNK